MIMKVNLLILGLVLLTTACGTKNNKQNKADNTSENDRMLSEEVSGLVHEISVIDCEMYVRIASGHTGAEAIQDSTALAELRRKKISAVAKLTVLVPDSTGKAKVRTLLDSLKNDDNYCNGLKNLQQKFLGVKQKSVSSKELNMNKDAAGLADLNCRILSAGDALKKDSANTKAAMTLRKLREEKRMLSASLMEMYGPEILKNSAFRLLVKQAADAGCNYSVKIKSQSQF
jgi:hypothetical protein